MSQVQIDVVLNVDAWGARMPAVRRSAGDAPGLFGWISLVMADADGGPFLPSTVACQGTGALVRSAFDALAGRYKTGGKR
jgi:hypothetical protein